jgi:hypothetical protein
LREPVSTEQLGNRGRRRRRARGAHAQPVRFARVCTKGRSDGRRVPLLVPMLLRRHTLGRRVELVHKLGLRLTHTSASDVCIIIGVPGALLIARRRVLDGVVVGRDKTAAEVVVTKQPRAPVVAAANPIVLAHAIGARRVQMPAPSTPRW